MALPADLVVQIQSTATAGNVNGGGFNKSNANFLADGVIASGTGNSATISSATYSFVAGDVGHWIYLPISGSITIEGYYQIASVSTGTATLNTAIGQGIQIVNYRYGPQTVAGVSASASITNVVFGVDYSQSDTSPFTASNLTGTTTTATSATVPFTPQMVGNLIHINNGTNPGWFEIVSVSAGTATFDRTVVATITNLTFHTGGALSLGSALDSQAFNLGVGTTTASPRYFIKSGTYIMGGAVSALGSVPQMPINFEGYASTRGDLPTGSTRPLLNFITAGAGWTSGNASDVRSIQFLSNVATVFQAQQRTRLFNVKITNNSSTAGRVAFSAGAVNESHSSEFISYRGTALSTGGTGGTHEGNYIHDSNIGIAMGASNTVINNIVAGCVTTGISLPNGTLGTWTYGNTIYGAENQLGTGISVGTATGTYNNSMMNNILYGLAVGIAPAGFTTAMYDNYNNYFNNTADIGTPANWQKGANDLAVDPSFTNVVQRTGATATTTTGSHLVQTGALFQTWGIVAGQDYIYIKSGTGITAGIYGILSVDSETQITVDITLTADATADKVWQITQGQNFAVGMALKGTGSPGVFPGGLTTGYLDIGAVQRQESGGGGNSSYSYTA